MRLLFARALSLFAALWLLSILPAEAAAPPTHAIGVFGDSLGDGVWSGLYPIVKAHPGDTLFRRSKVGSGLTRPDYAAWFQDFTAALDADHPNCAVVMFGANDEQSIRDESHKGYLFRSAGWSRVYQARVDAILAEFAKRKIAVFWLGLPVMRNDEFNRGAVFLNALFADSARQAKARFMPLADAFKGPDGGFATHLPDAKGRLKQVRAEDGVHFTGYGYQLVAAKIYDAIAAPPPIAVAHVTTP